MQLVEFASIATWLQLLLAPAFSQSITGTIEAVRIVELQAQFDAVLIESKYSLDVETLSHGRIYPCGFGPFSEEYFSGVDSVRFLFPELSDNAINDLWSIVEFVSALKIGLRASDIDEKTIDGVLAEFSIDTHPLRVEIAHRNSGIVGTGFALKTFRNRLQTPEQQQFEWNISCMILSDRIEVPVSTKGNGARIFWSTPFRERLCAPASKPKECAWSEITGNATAVLEGTRIFLAEWPDGVTVRRIYSSNDLPSAIVLGE